MTDILAIARECGADFDDACSDGSRVVVHLLSDQLVTFVERIRQGVTEHATPPGWRLVPLEPTPEMLVSILAYTDEEARSLWRAAVLAAPPPCAAEVEPDAWMRLDEEGVYCHPDTYKQLSPLTRANFAPLFAKPVRDGAWLTEAQRLVDALCAEVSKTTVLQRKIDNAYDCLLNHLRLAVEKHGAA